MKSGIAKVRGTIAAKVSHQVIQIRHCSAEMHQATFIFTMVQIEEVPQFVKRHFGGAFEGQ